MLIKSLIVTVILLIVACLIAIGYLEAQTPTEIKPYEFSFIENNGNRIHVYKMVHEGCEIFVASGDPYNGSPPSVAITTGRSCK